MVTKTESAERSTTGAWYGLEPEVITARLGVDPAVGLSSQRGAELLTQNGPNALPAEQTVPTWKRLAGQYRSDTFDNARRTGSRSWNWRSS